MALNTKKITPFIPEAIHAFKIMPKSDPNNPGSIKVQIAPGTVNNLIPSNIASNGVLTQFSVQKDTLTNIICKCNSNGKQLNSATILVKAGDITPQTPVAFGLPSSVEILIGAVYNTTVYQCINTNIHLGARVQYISENKTNQSLPYTIYLAWAV